MLDCRCWSRYHSVWEGNIDGQAIKNIRERLDLTQQELAQMLGVHPMTVSKWERDKAQPTPYNIQQLQLMANGTEGMEDDERARFASMVAMGLFVGALGLVVGVGVTELGKKMKWW